MRTPTAAELALLSTAGKRLAYILEIEDAAGAWQDFTDWTMSIGGGESVDEPIPTVDVELRRDHDELSISPFRSDSPLNVGGAAIDAGRGIRVSIAHAAYGTDPLPGDFRVVFDGTIDTVDFSQPNVAIHARLAAGAALVDAWVREETNYGTEDGEPLETVIQQIIDQWAPGYTLDVPAAPGFVITPYLQQAESVWDAIRTLAAIIGWDVRFLWNEAAGEFRPTLIEPDRAKVVPDYTFAPAFIYDVEQLAVDRTWVRNVIVVTYLDEDGATQQVTRTDPTSIARFDEQWAEIIRGEGSPINTESEAIALGDAALSDMAWPVADQTVQVPYFWPVELGDLYRFSANGIHYDTDYDLAVTGHRWEIRAKRARSWLTVRGKPAGFYRDWIRRGTPPADNALEITNLREVERTATQIKYAFERGGRVAEVWVFKLVRDNPPTEEPWPDGDDPVAEILLEGEDSFWVDIPAPDELLYVQAEPHAADPAIAGPPQRIIVSPTMDPPDRVVTLRVDINDDDGSAVIRGDVVDRTLSIRYTYKVGSAPNTDPAAITDSEVEAATALNVTGSFAIALPAGTVPLDYRIRVAVAPYRSTNGVGGLKGRTDHGEIKRAEGKREKAPVEWKLISVDDSDPATGYATVELTDPTGIVDQVVRRTKAGEAEWVEAIEAGPYSDGQQFTAAVAKIEKHQSNIAYIARALRNGVQFFIPIEIAGFDKGAIPDIGIIPRIDETAATLSAIVQGDPDTFSSKLKAYLKSAYPGDVTAAGEVRATSAMLGRNLTAAAVGVLLSGLIPGEEYIIAGFGYGPNGEETTELVTADVIFSTMMATLEPEDHDENAITMLGTYSVRLKDRGGQAERLLYMTRDAGTAWPAVWSVKSLTPAHDTVYTETVALREKHGAQIMFGVEQVINGQLIVTTATSPVFDPGKIANMTGPADIGFTPGTDIVRIGVKADADTRVDGVNPSIIATVAIDSDPADPTLGANDGSIAAASGTIVTAVTCPSGSYASVLVRAINDAGELGPVAGPYRKYNQEPKPPAAVNHLELQYEFQGNDCVDIGQIKVIWDVTAPSGYTVSLTRYDDVAAGLGTGTLILFNSTTLIGDGLFDRGGYLDAMVMNEVLYVVKLTLKDSSGNIVLTQMSNTITADNEAICP